MAGASEVHPEFSSFYEVAAVLTCLAGSHSALLLASASITLNSLWLRVLSALQFVVQSIFSLHFIAMCGMRFGMDWGFDIGLTLVSLACVVLFGTGAISLTLWLRCQLQTQIKEKFGDMLTAPGLLFYPKLLVFIVVRVPLLQLVLAVVLMVVGAAGCHHVGMWSIHGLSQGHLTSQLTYWSFLTTVALGGAVCVVAILSFLVVPQGPAAIGTALLLTGGIAAFHFSSAVWGMRYLLGVEGVSTQLIMGSEAIIMFVLAQGAISQVITALFTRMALEDHAANLKLVAMAQTLGQHIRDMDLEPAKALQLEADNPSELEQTLFGIVDNLLMYRPYLPDTLFQPRTVDGDALEVSDADDSMPDRTPSNLTSPRHKSTASGISEGRCIGLRPRSAVTKGRRAANNLSIGLRPSHLTLLRARLLCVEHGAVLTEQVEEQLMQFMALATCQVKANGGTIVTCASGLLVAMWNTVSPEAALDTALAIQQLSDLNVVQVVQTGMFFSGNLAAEQLRSFNVAGPLDWPGQQLLRLGGGGKHVFITTQEWHHVRLRYRCLPFEQVVVNGEPVTVYVVLPTNSQQEVNKEWMYEMAERSSRFNIAGVDQCWQAYLRGAFVEVQERAFSLPSDAIPPWYPLHLASLAQQALGCRVKLPTKSLETFGWPALSAAPAGSDFTEVIIIQDF